MGIREYSGFDRFHEVFAIGHDETAPRTAEGLVGSGRHEVGVIAGVLAQARGDDPGDVGHVDHEKAMGSFGGIVGIDELPHPLEVDRVGIGGIAGKE